MKKKKMLALLLALTLLMGMAVTSCSSSSSKKDTSKKHSSKTADDEDDDGEDDEDDEDEKDVKDKDNDKDSKKDKDDNKVEISNTPEDAVDEYMKLVIAGDYDAAAALTKETEHNISTLFDELDSDQSKLVNHLLTTCEYEVNHIYEDDIVSGNIGFKFKSYETAYDNCWNRCSITKIDKFLAELDSLDNTYNADVYFEFAIEDNNWIITSDIDLYDCLYDMVETFRIPTREEFLNIEIENYLNWCFTDIEMAKDLIYESDMGTTLALLMCMTELEDDFLDTYLDYITYDWTINSIDEKENTVNLTVTTLVPDTYELKSAVYHNRDILVTDYAYTCADESYTTEHNTVLSNMIMDAYTTALPNCTKKSKSVDIIIGFQGLINNARKPKLGNCYFSDVVDYSLEYTDSELYLIEIDGLNYAYTNGLIDKDTFEAYRRDLIGASDTSAPTTPTPTETPAVASLRVENSVFYADTSVLGMSYDEANQFYGYVFSTPEVWEWGTYDSYLDFYFDDNMYTAFFANNTLMAIRKEFIASDIPEEILSAYNELYGSSSILSDEYGNNIMRGEQGSGYRFFTDFGHIDVFMNIYDDLAHVAIHYSL